MPTSRLSIGIDSELKARLMDEAKLQCRSASIIVQIAIENYLRDKAAYKRECLRQAAAELDEGVFISEEAVNRWMASWGTDHELPPPEPDIFLNARSK